MLVKAHPVYATARVPVRARAPFNAHRIVYEGDDSTRAPHGRRLIRLCWQLARVH